MYKLVIVESPAKCAKIQGFLGAGWKVLASMGHIRALKDDLNALDIDKGFTATYEFMHSKAKTIAQLKEAAKAASIIYLASDDDREGEAISYSIAIALKLDVSKNPRIVFHEITAEAITKALKNPTTINMQRVYSQQGRSVLDLMVGYSISPLLWKHVGKGLSAGRCQTPALRIIVERDIQIKNFKQEFSWKIKGSWKGKSSFQGVMNDDLEDIESVINYFEQVYNQLEATVHKLETKDTFQKPPQALMTSTLQQEASALYRSSPKATMAAAQKLYEAGLITYMRTDNPNMSCEAIDDAKQLVLAKYGQQYLGTGAAVLVSGDAHEAIRPTHFATSSIDDCYSSNEKNIYTLIYKRALQSVMATCVGQQRVAQWSINNDPNEFSYTGTWKRTTFLGWKKVGQVETDLDESEELHTDDWYSSEDLRVGSLIQWSQLEGVQQHTSAPAKYTEATLVRELEKKGIGRPSTYAHLVESIVSKDYVVKQPTDVQNVVELTKLSVKPNMWPPTKSYLKKIVKDAKGKLKSTELGVRVHNFCMQEFPTLFDYNFTKQMELELDDVERGKQTWNSVCQNTWDSYKDKYTLLKEAKGPEKIKVCVGDYEIVQTKHGPCLVKSKVFYGWPPGLKAENITAEIIENYIEKKNAEDTLGVHEGVAVLKKKGPYGAYVCIDGKNISLQEHDTLETVLARLKNAKESLLHVIEEFQFRKGPYGNYMMKKAAGGKKPKFVSLPSELDVKKLTYEAAKRIYDTNSKKKPKYEKK